MLEEAAGVDDLDKVRVIHIFEVDFNFIVCILWSRRMMTNAEKHKATSPYQWARKGKQSIEPAVMKVSSVDLSAYTRTTLGAVDKDAALCFARIVMCFANQSPQGWGMEGGPCEMIKKVLEFAMYRGKTQFRVTTEGYSCSIEKPFYGPT